MRTFQTTQQEVVKILRHNQLVINAILESNTFPTIPVCQGSPTSPMILVESRWLINFGSNCYLNLANHPRVIEAACRAIRNFGLGAGASRVTAGTTTPHLQLEARIADFKGTEDAIILPAGSLTNLGVLPALINPHLAKFAGSIESNIRNELYPTILVLMDELVHASIIDGVNLAVWSDRTRRKRIRVERYNHCNMDSLARKLDRDDYKVKLIITDGVFSLHGHLAPLDQIVQIAKRYNASIYIDDAHGTGVLGQRGRGTAEHFGVENDIDIQMGTLSKALGGLGGFVAGDKELCTHLRTCRPNIFATAMPPAIAAGLIEGFDIIEEEPEIRERLWENVHYTISEINLLGFNTCNSQSQIIPILVGDTQTAKDAANRLNKLGIHVQAYYYPALPDDEAIVRINLMADHTREHLDILLEKLAIVGREFYLI